MGHHLWNGNKRLAITTLRTLLLYYGYYLKWSSGGQYIYEETYKPKCEEFVKMLRGGKPMNPTSKGAVKVEYWIYKNVVLNYKFDGLKYY